MSKLLMSLSKCAVALATSLPVQCCCWILMAGIQLALHPPGGWDHLRCSSQGQKTSFTKAKKMNSWEQWSQIPVWYCAGLALTAFPLGRATVERVCQAPGASRMDAEHHCSRPFTPAVNKCGAMSGTHWLQSTWLLRKKLCCNYLCSCKFHC